MQACGFGQRVVGEAGSADAAPAHGRRSRHRGSRPRRAAQCTAPRGPSLQRPAGRRSRSTGMTTRRSPTATPPASGPTATTVPGDLVAEHARRRDAAAQVELRCRCRDRSSPSCRWTSLWHRPQLPTRTTTSRAAGLRRLAQHLSQGLAERVEGIADHGSRRVSCPADSAGRRMAS